MFVQEPYSTFSADALAFSVDVDLQQTHCQGPSLRWSTFGGGKKAAYAVCRFSTSEQFIPDIAPEKRLTRGACEVVLVDMLASTELLH